MVLNFGIVVKDIVIQPSIPKNDTLFQFCAMVNNTLAYFMHTDDNSVRMLGSICKQNKYAETFTYPKDKERNQINALLSKLPKKIFRHFYTFFFCNRKM